MPGIKPLKAYFLKHNLHKLNILKKPLGLPQSLQRFLFLVENLGSLFAFSINAFLAIKNYSLTNGILRLSNKARAILSSLAVVWIEMFIPKDLSTLS